MSRRKIVEEKYIIDTNHICNFISVIYILFATISINISLSYYRKGIYKCLKAPSEIARSIPIAYHLNCFFYVQKEVSCISHLQNSTSHFVFLSLISNSETEAVGMSDSYRFLLRENMSNTATLLNPFIG